MNTQPKQKVIFYAPILSWPPKGGPEMSVVNAIKVLNQICELHVITNLNYEDLRKSETLDFLARNCFRVSFCPRTISVGQASIKERIIRFIKREIFPSIYSSYEANFIEKYALKQGIEIFWIDRVIEHSFHVFIKIRNKFPDSVIVGDTEAVYSRFILRELPLIKSPIRWFRVLYRGNIKLMQEKALVKKANLITAVSMVDAEYYYSLSENIEKVFRFSNSIDIEAMDSENKQDITLKRPYILLLGTFGHANSPMDRAAKWLHNEIMPIVWKAIPQLHLYVVGLNADKTQSSIVGANVTVIGSPSTVVPYLRQAIATVVPLKFESGTRFKIIESGAASIACISTVLGAEGLNVEDGKDILIADSADSFANAIIRVVQNPELSITLGKNLHEIVKKFYSLDTQKKEAKIIFEFIRSL